MLGLEPAAFGQGEPLVREREIGDGFQCRLHQAELLLETGAERRERRCRAIRWAHRIERRRQQRPALLRVLARAIGADEGERLLSFETVPLYRSAHGFLGVVVEGTERVRQRDPHRALVDTADDAFIETVGQRQSGRHPRRLSAEDVGYSLGAEPVIVAHRMHHPGFVHRRERARRPIGLEQGHLLRQSRSCRFQDHRHLGNLRCPPPLETLETVDELVFPVGGLHRAKRHLLESNRSLRGRLAARTQHLETCAYPLDGDKTYRRTALAWSVIARAGQWKRCCHDQRPFAATRAPASSDDDAGPGDGRDKTCRKPSESYRPNGK
jgi:hypothetical protein